MKTFAGAWSKYKLRMIQTVICRFIEGHGVTTVAIKSPHTARSSKNLTQLVLVLTKVCSGKHIPVCLHTISELKKHCSQQNKKELMEYVAGKYVELSFIKSRQKGTKHSYYIKLFEAVAVADMAI